MSLSSGFLIVRTFGSLYLEYAPRYDLQKGIYSIPRIDKSPRESNIKYRGLDRDALQALEGGEKPAQKIMFQLEKEGCSRDDFIFNMENVVKVYESLGEDKTKYEIIWTRLAGSRQHCPPTFHSVGFEATYFIDDHFSASCDCMLFPRWHGTDKEGKLFSKYFSELNSFGLFGQVNEASEFLEYYLSFDWTERGEYEIAEVFIQHNGK